MQIRKKENGKESNKIHIDFLLSERHIKLVSEVELIEDEIELKVDGEIKLPTKKFIKILASLGGWIGTLVLILQNWGC